MSLAALIRSMAEAGAPPEAIALAVEAIEGDRSAVEHKRAVERDRKRAQRERDRASRDSHGTVTGQSADKGSPSPASPPKPPSPPTPVPERTTTRVKPTRRMPLDWKPAVELASWAVAEGFTAGELERELSKMKDHQFRDARADWDAVFRNWIRRAAETHRTTKDVRPRPSRSNDRDDRLQRMRDGALAALDGNEPGMGGGFEAGGGGATLRLIEGGGGP